MGEVGEGGGDCCYLSIRRDHLFSALRNRLKDNTQPFNQSEAALLLIVRVFVEGF